MITTAESIAAAIAEERPEERENAGELALEMAHAAQVRGVPLEAALAFIRDRPRVTYSAPAFLRWCERYRIVPAAELGKDEAKRVST